GLSDNLSGPSKARPHPTILKKSVPTPGLPSDPSPCGRHAAAFRRRLLLFVNRNRQSLNRPAVAVGRQAGRAFLQHEVRNMKTSRERACARSVRRRLCFPILKDRAPESIAPPQQLCPQARREDGFCRDSQKWSLRPHTVFACRRFLPS